MKITKIQLLQYEAGNDLLVWIISLFGSPKWISHYLAWKIEKKYRKHLWRLKCSARIKIKADKRYKNLEYLASKGKIDA